MYIFTTEKKMNAVMFISHSLLCFFLTFEKSCKMITFERVKKRELYDSGIALKFSFVKNPSFSHSFFLPFFGPICKLLDSK